MKEQKTLPNTTSVDDFLSLIDNEQKRKDAYTLVSLCEKMSGCPPVMWGSSIIGFGSYHYVYPTGHSGDAPLISFSPRKAYISIYTAVGDDNLKHLLPLLGKHKMGKACLYIKTLKDIKISILEAIIDESIKFLTRNYEVTSSKQTNEK